MIVFEFLGIVIKTVFELVPAILRGVFTVKDSVDSFQDIMTAAVFGVPVWVVTAIGTAILVINIAVRVYSWASDRL